MQALAEFFLLVHKCFYSLQVQCCFRFSLIFLHSHSCPTYNAILNVEFNRKYLLTVLYKIASEGHSKVKPHMWGHIMADVREKESCFQESSSSIIKMLDIFETVSSFFSKLYIFLGFESCLKQAFLGFCIGLFRWALRNS